MAEKRPILGGEIGFDQRGGEIDILQLDAAFACVGVDDFAIDAAHHGWQRGLVVEQAFGIGQSARQQGPGQHQDDKAQHDEASAPAKPAILAPVAHEPVARGGQVGAHAVTDCL